MFKKAPFNIGIFFGYLIPNYKIMRNWSLLLIGIAIGFTTLAQKTLTLCEKYDDNGIATGLYDSWNIDKTGGYVYIVYKQDKPIKAIDMQLHIDKKEESSGRYKAYKTIDLVPEKGKNWVMYDFEFTDKGKYNFQVINNGEEQATATTEIFFNADKTDNSADPDSEVDTYYYEESEILFGESVDANGNLEGESDEFKLGNESKINVIVYITNDNAFKTDKFYITIYDDEDQIVDEFDITVEPDWDWAKFTQSFKEPGDYMLDIYNANDVFVNTGYLTIKR